MLHGASRISFQVDFVFKQPQGGSKFDGNCSAGGEGKYIFIDLTALHMGKKIAGKQYGKTAKHHLPLLTITFGHHCFKVTHTHTRSSYRSLAY